MQLFCECLDIVGPKRFNSFKDNYTPTDYWILADYFIKYANKTISPIEEHCLGQWRSVDSWNERLFIKRPILTDRRKMFDWLIAEDQTENNV